MQGGNSMDRTLIDLLEKEPAYQHLSQAIYQAVDRNVDAASPDRCCLPHAGRRYRSPNLLLHLPQTDPLSLARAFPRD